MHARYLSFLILLSAVSLGGVAQSSDPSQNSGPPAQGSGQRGGRGAWGGGGMGRGVTGTVTEIAADHFTIKTECR